MSRRTGKAATRRARQQKRTRQGPGQAATSSAPPTTPDAPVEDATTVTATPVATPRPAVPAYAVGTSSRLSESARLEYHYVGRDLRNTAVLTLIMGVLLVVAVVAVNLISAAS